MSASALAEERRTTPAEHVLDPEKLADRLDRLFPAAWALKGAREDAEDLVQETCAHVLARPRLVRNNDDLGYLLRVLRNTFISKLRTTARRPRSVAAEPEALGLPDPRGTDEPPGAETRELLTAVASLPAEFRDAVVSIDVAGLSYPEAARALRVRQGTLASRLFRARSQVAESFSIRETVAP
jgi:RNA polymerase sigma-70 factor (ECF subfamily)